MNYLKLFWKPLLWAFIVITLSVVNTGEIAGPGFLNIPHIDKFVHFILYMVLTFLIIYDFNSSGIAGESLKLLSFGTAAAASLFGGGMEIIQLSSALHRSADIADFFANMAGSVAAVIVFRPVNRIIRVLLA